GQLMANWVNHGANAALVVTIASCAGALIVYRAPRSLRTLERVEAALVLTACACFGAMAIFPFEEDVPREAGARAIMAVLMTLTFRAVIVPSSARRTLLLGALAVPVPLALATSIYARENAGAALIGAHAVWTASWFVAAVFVSTLTSRVIYGLRKEVREAQQLGQYTLE